MIKFNWNIFILTFFILLLLFYNGCNCLRIKPPIIKLHSISLTGFDREGINLEVYMNLFNPNKFGATLVDLEYDIILNNIPFGTGKYQEQIKLIANDTSLIILPIKVYYKNLPQNAIKIILEGNVPYHIIGKVGIQTPLGVYHHKLDLEDEIKVADSVGLPSLKDAKLGLKIENITFNRIENFYYFIIILKIINPYTYPIDIHKLDFTLFLNENLIGTGNLASPVQILAEDEKNLRLILKTEISNLPKSLISILIFRCINYSFSANIEATSIMGDLHFNWETENKISLEKN